MCGVPKQITDYKGKMRGPFDGKCGRVSRADGEDYAKSRNDARGRNRLSGHIKLLADPAYGKLLAAEPYLRRAIPPLIIVFLLALASRAPCHFSAGVTTRSGQPAQPCPWQQPMSASVIDNRMNGGKN